VARRLALLLLAALLTLAGASAAHATDSENRVEDDTGDETTVRRYAYFYNPNRSLVRRTTSPAHLRPTLRASLRGTFL